MGLWFREINRLLVPETIKTAYMGLVNYPANDPCPGGRLRSRRQHPDVGTVFWQSVCCFAVPHENSGNKIGHIQA